MGQTKKRHYDRYTLELRFVCTAQLDRYACN